MNTTRESEIKRNALRKTAERRGDLLLIGLLFAWAFFVNRKLRMSGYYMDDLYMWSCWGEQSFLEYVFPLHSTRCRFVYWLAAWAELLVVGNHISWVVPINILLNGGLASFLYMFSKRLAKSRLVAFLAGWVFLSSRFAYYQVGQLLGLMETMGLFFAVFMAWCLYRYMNEENSERYFYIAAAVYFLNCFTHERYMVLLPMLFFALIVKRDRTPQRWILPAALFILMLVIRRLMIGTLSPAGTGGTQVADTVTKRGVLVNFFVEFLYFLGINAGPEHLNGMPWAATPVMWKLLILAPLLLLLVFLCMVVLDLLQGRKYALPWEGSYPTLCFFWAFWRAVPSPPQ